MKRKLNIFASLTLYTICTLFFSKNSYALNEKQFLINYDLSYTVSENGETSVEQQVSLVNLKNDVVPTNYSFTIKEINIYDVTAEANGKKVNVETVNNESESGFSVPIINHAIGKDRSNKILIKYKTNDIALKTGNVWNVFIPKIQVPDTTEVYSVKVQVPNKLGEKMFFSPTPIQEKKEGDNTLYYLNKDSFKGSGISAAFGTTQIINFKIKYQLENPTIIFYKYQIPLPPDIKDYQQVVYSKIEPKPTTIKLDADGNPMAVYLLGPKKKLEVEVTGSAKASTHQINLDYGGSFSNIPNDLVKKYTGEEKYWETDTKKISELVKTIKNNNFNVSRNAQIAYNYVIENMTYDFDAIKKDFVERQGSEAALTQKGSWTCMEFTDLFITVARAMGIPAREINGYAINGNETSKPLSLNFKNGDLLHAWAEYYDPYYGWVQVDPTWGNTSGIDYFSKLDTNHLTLVRRGLDSEYPQPAGAYRYEEGKKLIEIAFSEQKNDADFVPVIKVKKVFNFNLIQVIKGNKKYIASNEGKVFIYNSTGKPIPPGQKSVVFVSKNDKQAVFTTTDGSVYNIDL